MPIARVSGVEYCQATVVDFLILQAYTVWGASFDETLMETTIKGFHGKCLICVPKY